ncbi:hypothetical protein [Fimbriiglobus ruber]|uniref:hypothetical protein n=1 Tax=Fimbriiglobus ruber TaxID=1908690 RepID=UPI000B4A82E4|nr:hypothetical protein [Fimbriiglobus ruber]
MKTARWTCGVVVAAYLAVAVGCGRDAAKKADAPVPPAPQAPRVQDIKRQGEPATPLARLPQRKI